MPVLIFIKEKSTTELLVDPWKEKECSVGDKIKYQEHQWHNVITKIYERARIGNLIQYQVFLLLLGDYLISKFEEGYIGALIRKAQDYCWGSDVFLVVNESIPKNIYNAQTIFKLEKWLQEVYFIPDGNSTHCGAIDLLEVPEDCFDLNRPENETAKVLDTYIELSKKRLNCLFSLPKRKEWKVFAPKPTKELHLLLPQEMVIKAPQDLPDLGIIQVISSIENRMLEKSIDCTIIFGTTNGLPEKWLKKKGAAPCNNFFDVLYFLQHIKQHAVYKDEIIGTSSMSNNIQDINLKAKYDFNPFNQEPNSQPSLFISSSFSQKQDGKEYLISASKEVANIKRGLPPGFAFAVHPALSQVELAEFVNQTSADLTAWVFIGHGSKEGLLNENLEIGTGREWLKCFSQFQKGLALALFSACCSYKTAKLFAEAGVGVSIGFKKPVYCHQCWIMSKLVVSAALLSNGNTQAILGAFNQACNMIRRISNDKQPYPEPVAFLCNRPQTPLRE